MTNPEFSDAFSTMLNSYNTQMQFGEQASKAEIVLDEYEKSVFLTQAQDIIVKSYFDARLNAEGMGLDDGTKRQLDFSSLIRVASLSPLATQENTYDSRGIMYQMPIGADENSPQALFILNEKLVNTDTTYKSTGDLEWSEIMPGGVRYTTTVGSVINKSKYKINVTLSLVFIELGQGDSRTYYTKNVNEQTNTLTVNIIREELVIEEPPESVTINLQIEEELLDLDINLEIPMNTQSSLSEFSDAAIGEIPSVSTASSKEYVIVPISYKEYDRMMSRPYSQPLKKQAWRLFQNQVTGFDVQTELIPKFNVVEKDTATEKSEFLYKIRYVQRPTPIVLEDLPDGLSIDGVSEETPCMLNPVLHQDILNKAVDLAITTRGGTPAATQARQARRQEKD